MRFTDTMKPEVLQFTVNIMAHVCTLASLTLLNFVLHNMKGAVMLCESGAMRIHPRHSYMKVRSALKSKSGWVSSSIKLLDMTPSLKN
jgi:hypothetical protein